MDVTTLFHYCACHSETGIKGLEFNNLIIPSQFVNHSSDILPLSNWHYLEIGESKSGDPESCHIVLR